MATIQLWTPLLSAPSKIALKSSCVNSSRRHLPATARMPRVTALSPTTAADAALSCQLTPDLPPRTACALVPDLIEGAACDLAPALALGPSCPLTSADVGLEADVTVPTPVLPSGTMMAEFLLAYRRMLEHETRSGESAAAALENVLERIRVGLEGLLHHPRHGASLNTSSAWFRDESDVEACLWELEKDRGMFQRYQQRQPAPIAVRLTSLHCTEAARLLRRL